MKLPKLEKPEKYVFGDWRGLKRFYNGPRGSRALFWSFSGKGNAASEQLLDDTDLQIRWGFELWMSFWASAPSASTMLDLAGSNVKPASADRRSRRI